MKVNVPESLALVKNWHTLPRVKLFHTHRLRSKDGQVQTVDDQRVRQIASNVNRTGIRAGRWPTISEDHIVVFKNGQQYTRPSSEISILGYTCNYEVEDGVDEEGRPVKWIVGDCLIFPKEYERAKNLPYRSVEFKPSVDMITNVAFTKHAPLLEVPLLLPEHWEAGSATSGRQLAGIAASGSRLVAYTLNSQDGIIVYSIQGQDMNNDTLLQELSNLRKQVSDMIEKVGQTPPPAPKVEPKVDDTISFEAHPEYIKMKAERDGLLKEKETLNADKTKLETEKRTADRKAKLDELAKTRKMNVEEEMKRYGDKPDDVFALHVEDITNCYAARSSGGATVEPLDSAAVSKQSSEILASAKGILTQRVRSGNDKMQIHHVVRKLTETPNWDGTGDFYVS
jgi:hypothetical protein